MTFVVLTPEEQALKEETKRCISLYKNLRSAYNSLSTESKRPTTHGMKVIVRENGEKLLEHYLALNEAVRKELPFDVDGLRAKLKSLRD